MNETSAEDKKLNRRRILLYLLLSFGMTWVYEFLVVWPVALSENPAIQSMSQLAVSAAMFFPALSVLLTRLITKEGFKDSMLVPKTGKRSIPYFLMGWFGPAVLTVIGAVIYFLIFPDSFDPSMGAMSATLAAQGLEATEALVTVTVVSQIVMGFLLAPLLNTIPCFGEEWGWRGYLLPKMQKDLKVLPTLLLSGLIWGIWHLPITILGHNYGTGYMGYPVTGILAMCGFCVIMGIIFSYLTIRTGSCLPAMLAHGSLNGFASAGILFTNGIDINPFVGPIPTGIIGGCAFIVCAIIMAALLLKKS